MSTFFDAILLDYEVKFSLSPPLDGYCRLMPSNFYSSIEIDTEVTTEEMKFVRISPAIFSPSIEVSFDIDVGVGYCRLSIPIFNGAVVTPSIVDISKIAPDDTAFFIYIASIEIPSTKFFRSIKVDMSFESAQDYGIMYREVYAITSDKVFGIKTLVPKFKVIPTIERV